MRTGNAESCGDFDDGILEGMMERKNQAARGGQAMILAVLALGGTMLGATAIAGFLMLYQIRQATDFEASSKAVFAADSGIQWALYSYLHPPAGPLPGNPAGTLSNGATLQVVCYDSTGATVTPCDSTSTAAEAISKGFAGNTKRAFLIVFGGATSTLP
jgi:hypothetical protein